MKLLSMRRVLRSRQSDDHFPSSISGRLFSTQFADEPAYRVQSSSSPSHTTVPSFEEPYGENDSKHSRRRGHPGLATSWRLQQHGRRVSTPWYPLCNPRAQHTQNNNNMLPLSSCSSSGVAVTMLNLQLSDACLRDAELDRLLRPSTANAPTPAFSTGLHSGDVALLASLVEVLHPLLNTLPSTCHGLLMQLSRTVGAAGAGDDEISVMGGHIRDLLAAVASYDSDHGSMAGSLREIRLVAKASLISSPSSKEMSAFLTSLHGIQSVLPGAVIETIFASALPEVCAATLQHTCQRLGVHADGDASSVGSSAFSSAGAVVDGTWFFPLWGALLANDHFFNPPHFDAMHQCLLTLVQSLGPTTGVTGGSGAGLLVPAVNKTGRVYGRHGRGQALMALHSAFFSRHPQALRLLPYSYHLRLVGAIFDECSVPKDKHTLRPAKAVTAIATLPTGKMPAAQSETPAWDGSIVPLVARFCGLFASDPAAIDAVWKMAFKAAQLLDPHHDAGRRVAMLYGIFGIAGVPQDMQKEAQAQLTRLVTEYVEDGIRAEDVAGAVINYGKALSAAPTVTLHWAMNGVEAVLAALCRCQGLPLASRADIGRALLAWLQEDFFSVRKVSGSDPLKVTSIRRHAEQLGMVPQSPFWWICGCGAQNSGLSDVCSACMRNTHARWTCASKSCGAQHKHSSSACRHCGTLHPLVAAAEADDIPLCVQCELTPLDDDDQCPRCDQPNGTSAAEAHHKARVAPHHGLSECRACHHTHSSRVACPRCGTLNNAGETIIMWLCGGCSNYSFLFNKQCTRCDSRDKGTGRSTDTFRVEYAPWVCGCGQSNPFGRLGCGACGGGKQFTCTTCHKKSGARRARFETVTSPVTASATLRVCECEHCGELHPRDGYILQASSIEVSCFVCGGPTTVGSPACPRCLMPQGAFNPLLPFWCRRCGDTTTSNPSATVGPNASKPNTSAQTGYACSACQTPRSEISDMVFMWRCDGDPDRADTDSDAPVCNRWNPSWSSECAACGQSRIYDVFEVRCRNLGQWECADCHSVNQPSDILVCPRCDDGLHVTTTPCPHCGECHLAFECPSPLLKQQAEKLLEDYKLQSMLSPSPEPGCDS